MRVNLKQGQIVKIVGTEYTVIGMIAFKEDSWEWQEYKIINSSGRVLWLCVEEVEGQTVYSLFENCNIAVNTQNIEIDFSGVKYSLYEKGKAHVLNYFGKVDVDMYEICSYTEYINEQKTSIISVEDWDGEKEKSIGKILNQTDVEITSTINNNSNSGFSRTNRGYPTFSSKSIMISAFIGVILLILVISNFSSFSGSKSLSKFLSTDSNFEYATSVTNSSNKKIAKVYQTSLSVDAAVKKIIDGVPEGINKTVNETDEEEDGIGLFTKNEYAYVYTSSDNVTCVQVSETGYVNNSSSVYHSRYGRSSHYYRTFTSSSYDKNYSDYLSSARQSSISSRRSSGGGISLGK